MNKKVIAFIIVFIAICILFAMIGYYNHDKINELLDEDLWITKEVVASSTTQDVVDVSAGNYLALYTSDGLRFYNSEGKFSTTESFSSTKAKVVCKDDYTAVFAEDTSMLYFYKEKDKLWQNKISNQVQNISVNKKGYVLICFTPNGYKSGISVYNSNGNAILNKYLANNYATCSCLSNNNKQLFVGEVNLLGIKPQSYVSIIELSKSDTNAKELDKIEVATDEIITDLSMTSDGRLLILTDKSIYSLVNDNLEKLITFNENNTLFASITDVNAACVIEQSQSSTVSNNALLKRIGLEELHEKELEGIPQCICTSNDKIAVSIGDEVFVYNSNAKPVAKCSISDNVIALEFIKNGSTLALIYRNKIEFIKL